MAQTARPDPAPTEPTPPSDDDAFPDLELPPLEPEPTMERRRARPPSPPPSVSSRRTRVEIRHVGIWSVLKFSLLFYFCVMLVVYFALLIIYLGLQASGVLDSITSSDLIACLVNSAEGTKNCPPVVLNGRAIFTWLFVGGSVMTVAWAGLNVFVALIYNLISDVIGGVEVTLGDARRD
jgi:hypothetical protein